MAVEIVCICVILCCSWMIPSKKEIHQIAEVRNEYTKEATEEEVTDVLECKAFVPFLKTYHLGILFIVLCSHLCVNLIFFVVQERGKNEKEEMDG